jgi:uncharacterized protein YbaR (Trm112 family)
MAYLGSEEKGVSLLGRMMLVCPVCNNRNADRLYVNEDECGKSYHAIHDSCEKDLTSVYAPIYEKLEEKTLLNRDPDFLKDCYKKGIHGETDVWRRSSDFIGIFTRRHHRETIDERA